MPSITRRLVIDMRIAFHQAMYDWFGLNGIELLDAYLSQAWLNLDKTDKMILQLEGYVRLFKANYESTIEPIIQENPDFDPENPAFLHADDLNDQEKSARDHYKKWKSATADLKRMQVTRDQFQQSIISLTADRDRIAN